MLNHGKVVIVLSHPSISDLRQRILPLRQQADITDRWLSYRLQHVLPEIMMREGIDMWLVLAREYNEDPVVMSLLPAAMLTARRRTLLGFYLRPDRTVECINMGRWERGLNQFYTGGWDKTKETQWEYAARVVRERKPDTIGLNVSNTFAFGDGLTKTQYDELTAALDPQDAERVQSAERLAVGWLEKRTEEELQAYQGINKLAHDIIAKAFSHEVVHPGVTTGTDVAWWIRQVINDIGLASWFSPTVMIQRRGVAMPDPDTIIRPGDLLHCDVGLHYLGLATDTQQMAYVLRLDEAGVPADIQQALAAGNQLQDIFAASFVAGRTGNEIFQEAIEQAKAQGLEAMIYTHPIGYHGHGAGPTIGLFDQQSFVKGSGEYPLHENTCYAVELNVKYRLPSWDDQEVMIALEQTSLFNGDSVQYLGGRQTAFHVIQ